MEADCAVPGRPARRLLLQARVLGGCMIAIDGRPLPEAAFKRRRAFRLLLLLLTTPGHSVPRDVVLETLWPERDPQATGVGLRVVLNALRSALQAGGLGHPSVVSASAAIRLHPDVEVQVDAVEFERQARLGLESNSVSVLRSSVDLYQGALLPTVAYEEWAERLRSSLATLYERVLVRLAALADRLDPAGMSVLEGRLYGALAADATSEALAVALMRLLAFDGRRRDALRVYDDVAAALASEVGVLAGVELEALRGRLLSPAARRTVSGAVSLADGALPHWSGVLTLLQVEVRSLHGSNGDDERRADLPVSLRSSILGCIGSSGGAAYSMGETGALVAAVFTHMSAALRAALLIRRLQPAPLAGSRQRSLAMAIHCGEATFSNGVLEGGLDPFTNELLRNARAGQTLISQLAAALASGVLPQASVLRQIPERLIVIGRLPDVIYELFEAPSRGASS